MIWKCVVQTIYIMTSGVFYLESEGSVKQRIHVHASAKEDKSARKPSVSLRSLPCCEVTKDAIYQNLFE